MTVNVPNDSKFAGRSIADIFDQFPELVVVAIIHKQQIQLPRGSSQIEGGDQLLMAASDTTSIRELSRMRLAEGRAKNRVNANNLRDVRFKIRIVRTRNKKSALVKAKNALDREWEQRRQI